MDEWRELRRLWQKLLFPVILPVLLLFAWLVGQNIGFPQVVEKSMDACVYTEDRELIACMIELRGTITHYPLNKQRQDPANEVEIFLGERRVAVMPWNYGDGEVNAVFGRGWTGAVRGDGSLVLIEQDLSRVFPDRDSMRCVLIAPGMELEGMLALIETLEPEVKAQFVWLKELMKDS